MCFFLRLGGIAADKVVQIISVVFCALSLVQVSLFLFFFFFLWRQTTAAKNSKACASHRRSFIHSFIRPASHPTFPFCSASSSASPPCRPSFFFCACVCVLAFFFLSPFCFFSFGGQKMATKQTSQSITLRGSANIVTEFFGYGINSILYQRGIYPPEQFQRAKKYGLTLLTTADESLKAYISNILGQLHGMFALARAVVCMFPLPHPPHPCLNSGSLPLFHWFQNTDWLLEKTVQKVVLVISSSTTSEVRARVCWRLACMISLPLQSCSLCLLDPHTHALTHTRTHTRTHTHTLSLS